MPEKATDTRSSTSHGQGLAFEVFKPRLVDAAKPVRWISPLIEQGEHLHNARGGIQRVVDRLGGAGQMVLPARKWQLVFAGLGLVPVADLGEALQEIDRVEEPVLTRPVIDAKSSIAAGLSAPCKRYSSPARSMPSACFACSTVSMSPLSTAATPRRN